MTLALASNGLTFVVVGTVAFSLLISILFLVTHGSDSIYDQIGQGGLTKESDYTGTSETGAGGQMSAAATAEQEREIRQMLHARSERMVARGEPALDVEAELQRLLGGRGSGRGTGQHDPALLAEVRQLVQARNERRLRQGLDPLDEDQEVARTLDELDPPGGV
ncbi:MAG: hypothetical protein ACYDC2_04650 [Solirubrobacteraceae bacterium]